MYIPVYKTSLYRSIIKLDIIIIFFNIFSYKFYIKIGASIHIGLFGHVVVVIIIRDTLNIQDSIPLPMISFSATLPYSTFKKIEEVSTAERIKKRQAAALLISMGYSRYQLNNNGDFTKDYYRERGYSVTVSLSVPEPIYNMVFDLVDLHHLPRSTVVAHMIEAGYEAWKHEKEEVKK